MTDIAEVTKYREDLLSLARMADGKGDVSTAKEALRRVDAIDRTRAYTDRLFAKSEPVRERSIGERIGRPFGLAARYAIEGTQDLANVVAEPVRVGLNYIPGVNIQKATRGGIPDMMGLPAPETKIERVVGDASRLLTPGAAGVKVGNLLSKSAGPVARGVGGLLEAQPAQQLLSAGASGAAGGYAREEGAGPLGQAVAALGGGLSVPLAGAMYNKLKGPASSVVGGNVDAAVDRVIEQNQIDPTGWTIASKNALRKQIAKAVRAGADPDPNVVRRMADYATVGATPTRGTVTLDPAQITLERNLAKLGVNTGDEALQRLGTVQRQNDIILAESLNRLGADKADDTLSAGQKIIEALRAADAPRKSAVDAAYKAVRDSQGRYANLNAPEFLRMANDALDEQMLGSALPDSARKLLNDISAGKVPLNVNTMVQIDKRLSGQARDAMAAGNSEAALAIKRIRTALQDAPIDSNAGTEATALYQQARQMAAQRFRKIEQTPALKAALDNEAPDKFVQTFITGSGSKANARDVASLADELSNDPAAFEQARGQILAFLKAKALNGAPDEVGNFSPSAYRKAINSIGDTKLGMFFKKEEIARMKAVGRVASYEKFQPTGSAVNNSNTAGALIGKALDLAGKVPLGRALVVDPLESVARGRQVNAALNPSLLGATAEPAARLLLPPAIYGGLLPLLSPPK